MRLFAIGLSVAAIAALAACSAGTTDTSESDATNPVELVEKQATEAMIHDVIPDAYTSEIKREDAVWLNTICGKELPAENRNYKILFKGYSSSWSIDDRDAFVDQSAFAWHGMTAARAIKTVMDTSCKEWTTDDGGEKVRHRMADTDFTADQFASQDIDTFYGYCVTNQTISSPSAFSESHSPWHCTVLLGRGNVATNITAGAQSEEKAMKILKEVAPLAATKLAKV